MEWISVEKKPPEENALYAICVYHPIHKQSVPASAFAVLENKTWYWWVDGIADKVESKVTHYMELEFPKED